MASMRRLVPGSFSLAIRTRDHQDDRARDARDDSAEGPISVVLALPLGLNDMFDARRHRYRSARLVSSGVAFMRASMHSWTSRADRFWVRRGQQPRNPIERSQSCQSGGLSRRIRSGNAANEANSGSRRSRRRTARTNPVVKMADGRIELRAEVDQTKPIEAARSDSPLARRVDVRADSCSRPVAGAAPAIGISPVLAAGSMMGIQIRGIGTDSGPCFTWKGRYGCRGTCWGGSRPV